MEHGLPAQNQGRQDATEQEIKGKKEDDKKGTSKRDKTQTKSPHYPGSAARLRHTHTEVSQHLPFICMGMTDFKRPIYKTEA